MVIVAKKENLEVFLVLGFLFVLLCNMCDVCCICAFQNAANLSVYNNLESFRFCLPIKGGIFFGSNSTINFFPIHISCFRILPMISLTAINGCFLQPWEVCGNTVSSCFKYPSVENSVLIFAPFRRIANSIVWFTRMSRNRSLHSDWSIKNSLGIHSIPPISQKARECWKDPIFHCRTSNLSLTVINSTRPDTVVLDI